MSEQPIEIESGLTGIFITPQLGTRPPKTSDYRRENLAVHELADKMLQCPRQVLPRFVELAMEVTGGTSAGLSLYRPEAPDVLRWDHVRGRMASVNGLSFPRESPCGISMGLRRPQLSTHPERAFAWIADANISLPEVLHIPLHLNNNEPLGTLWVVADETGHFDGGDARAASELASFVSIALRMSRSETLLKSALEEQEKLAGEMSHRVKNVLTVVDGLIRMSARRSTGAAEMAEALTGRLQALAKAQGLVKASPGAASGAASPALADLRELLAAIVEPYEERGPDGSRRFSLNGPAVPLGEQASNSMALVFHELATNAAKYGAATSEGGQVAVTWIEAGGRLYLTWSESGGPAVAEPPSRSGFGSKLVRGTVAGRLDGSVDVQWRSTGLLLSLDLPMASLAL
ncbi:MAG: GAF domain-containing protein [Parafilimonas terrae]|nr:GAF domain-containing protein [Parafilimonas terrae]